MRYKIHHTQKIDGPVFWIYDTNTGEATMICKALEKDKANIVCRSLNLAYAITQLSAAINKAEGGTE